VTIEVSLAMASLFSGTSSVSSWIGSWIWWI